MQEINIEGLLDAAFEKVMGRKVASVPARIAVRKSEGGTFLRPSVSEAPIKFTIADELIVGGAAWRAQVEMKLRDGFGVEDIALWLNCGLDIVQNEVNRLRASGVFAVWRQK